jgi:hypothetical protein
LAKASSLTPSAEADVFDKLRAKYLAVLKELLGDQDVDFGKVTMSYQRKDIFPFEKLPAELRVAIYGLVLVAKDPIRISHRKSPAATQAAKDKWNEKRDLGLVSDNKSAVPGHVYELVAKVEDHRPTRSARPGTFKWYIPYADAHTISILRLDKQTYAEAHPVLYSDNHFCFDKGIACGLFLSTIGCGRKALVDIHVHDIGVSIWNPYLRGLREATMLRRLKIGLTPDYRSIERGADLVARSIMPNIYPRSSICTCEISSPCTCIVNSQRLRLVSIIAVESLARSKTSTIQDEEQISGQELEQFRANVLTSWMRFIQNESKRKLSCIH